MANHIPWLGSGTVPQSDSTMRILWAKKVATIQSNLGNPNSNNDPKPWDTIWKLKEKALRAATATTTCFTGKCPSAAANDSKDRITQDGSTRIIQ